MNYFFKLALLIVSCSAYAGESAKLVIQTFAGCKGWAVQEQRTSLDHFLIATHKCSSHLYLNQIFTINFVYNHYILQIQQMRSDKRLNKEAIGKLKEMIELLKGKCCAISKEDIKSKI